MHVLPGRIMKGDREYGVVRDFANPDYATPLPKAILSPKSIALPAEFRNDTIKIKALVRENAVGSELQFSYEAAFQGTLALIPPGKLTQRVLSRTGLVTCNKRACGEHLVLPCSIIQEGWDTTPYTWSREKQTTECLIWPFQENDLGRCVAIATAPTADGYYVRMGECLPCCTKAVANKPFSVIV